MRAPVCEARTDAPELQRRSQERPLERSPLRVVIGKAFRVLEADACQRLPITHVLGRENAPVFDEHAVRIAGLDKKPKTVAGARIDGKVEFGLEDLNEFEQHGG